MTIYVVRNKVNGFLAGCATTITEAKWLRADLARPDTYEIVKAETTKVVA